MKEFSESEKTKLLNSYLNVHGGSYTPSEIKMLKKEFGSEYRDHMTQIYYALNLLSDEENPYLAFSSLIEKKYGIDINILEVCGGVYPALSYSIARRQSEVGKGSITVYDELLSKGLDNKKIRFEKKTFTSHHNVSNYDLIVAKEPCSGTFAVIESARDKKDLILSPCTCYSLLPEYMDYSDCPLDQWYDFVRYLLRDNRSDIETEYLDPLTRYSNPIYCKKLKK